MKYIFKSVIFWFLAIVMAAGVAVYQRTTGPTYPVSGKVELNDETVSYRLIRSWGKDEDARIVIPVKIDDVIGEFSYKRYKSHDDWSVTAMGRTEEGLVAYIPHQPPAGKVMYEISMFYNNQEFVLTEEPVIIRFKGHVPDWVTIMHVIFIFLAFIFSMRTGFEALIKGKYTFAYTVFTLILLIIGGLILGPVMQKYAFGAYWTGWPVGHDLTDNKTAFAAIFWLVAFFIQLRNRKRKGWAAIASLVLLLVYLIPHSVLGSELDFRELEKNDTEMVEEV